jgi:hypothetical protein
MSTHLYLKIYLFIYLFIICVFYFFVFLKSLYLFRGVCVVAVGVAWEGGGFGNDSRRRRGEEGRAGANMRLIQVEYCYLINESRHKFVIRYIHIYLLLFYKYKFLIDLAIFSLDLIFVFDTM